MSTEITPEPGNLVEWYSQSGGIRGGIVSNVPATRRIGQVNHILPSGFASVYDQDGIRAMVPVEKLTVLREKAFPGWATVLGSEQS